ncbi:MAG: hypothetical protein IKX68_10165 [Clostridiales bacterium]|nr:hypothetical protein [Clostridiales bacterium]
MHTIQASIVFSIVFAVICGILAMNPIMYARTEEIAGLSVSCQKDSNHKDDMFKVKAKTSNNNSWDVEFSCPEKAYRFSKGIRDSVRILIG